MPSRAEQIAHIHAGPEHYFRQLAPGLDADELTAYYRALYRADRFRIAPYKNVAKVLGALQAAGLKLAVVSSARSARDSIKSHNLDTYFAAIVDGSSTEARKPDPEPLVLALKGLGVRPDEAVMVGDLPADVEASRAARLRAAIVLTHGYGSKEILQAAKPDYTINSFDELHTLIDQLRAVS